MYQFLIIAYLFTFHAKCSNLEADGLLKIETGNSDWCCTNCKADCCLCSDAVLSIHEAVQCDGCEMWIHNECSVITEAEYINMYLNLVVLGFVQNANVSAFRTLSLLVN